MFLLAPLVGLVVGSGQIGGSGNWERLRVLVPDAATLERLENSDFNLMECVPHLGTTDVAVPPGGGAALTLAGYQYSFVSTLENPTHWAARHASGHARVTEDYRFHYFNADQILAFFEDLRTQYPAYISRKSIGTTINGETMWAYQFTSPANSRTPNAIVIEGLIHAREWITGSSIMHIARKTVETLANPAGSRFLSNQALWIVPITNPDGYRYTWTNDRFWRKNRRHNSNGSFGVDVNRNFSKGYGQNGGSSTTQSSETYRGTGAFSEPESQAIRSLVQSLPRVGGFIDYHSYSQLILTPWGYTTAPPTDSAMFNTIGNAMVGEMNGFGATYEQGETSQILYIASGTSNDWVYDANRSPAIGIELRDTGQFGFDLPESEIFATQDEVWAGFKKYLTFMGS